MTALLSLLQRAKQGDAIAIAGLMNDVLEAQNVCVKATLDGNCLQVMLKAPTTLHQAHCIAFMRRGLLRLQPAVIQQVTAYAWRVGDAFPLWIAAFPLEQAPSPQPQGNGSVTAMVVRSSTDGASVPPVPQSSASQSSASQSSVSQPPATRQQSGLLALPANAWRQYAALFRLGVVIVLTTVVYWMVLVQTG